jgi:DNA-binding MurR/RpiR family transcriptional regulator
MKGNGQKYEQKKEGAICALLQEPSIEMAAKKAGISESTLFRWLKLEEFQEEYRAAKKELVNHAICRLQHSAGKAVDALAEIMEDKESPSSSRVSAAKTILEISFKAFEIEELERRIAALEKLIKERDQNRSGANH